MSAYKKYYYNKIIINMSRKRQRDPYTIRHIQSDEIGQFLDINLAGLLEFATSSDKIKGTNTYFNRIRSKEQARLQKYCEKINDPTFVKQKAWIAIDNSTGKIIGTMLIKKRDPRSRDTKGIQLDHVCVIPSWRGTGVAQDLLSTVENYCKQSKIPTIYLTTQDNLTRAIKFYEKQNFQYIKTQKFMDSYDLLYYSKLIK